MKSQFINIFCITLIAILVGCAGKESTNKPEATSWAGKMQNTAIALQKLLPYIYNKEKFNNPENKNVISSEIGDFKKSIHAIDKESAKKTLGDDPYVLQSLDSLHELVDRASESFERGDNATANILLKATTNTCFKCHTRQNMGPESLAWKDFHPDQLETSAFEKANLSVAMRQYEEAKTFLNQFMQEREESKNFDMQYENALHFYLMIALRGQKTLEPVIKFLVARETVIPKSSNFHLVLKKWNKDIAYWTKNQKNLKPNLASAKKVLARNKRVHGDENLINDLIASSLLHEYLMSEKENSKKAAAYQMLGKVYDDLLVEGYWDLPEVYYELCIRLKPKSKLAQQCYSRFRDNIVLGYSGSRGTMIPAKEYDRLLQLAEMAGVKTNNR